MADVVLEDSERLLEMLKKRWIEQDLREREAEFRQMVRNIQYHCPSSPIVLSEKEAEEAIGALKDIKDGRYPNCSQKVIYALEDLNLVFQPIKEPPMLNAKAILSEKHYRELMALLSFGRKSNNIKTLNK